MSSFGSRIDRAGQPAEGGASSSTPEVPLSRKHSSPLSLCFRCIKEPFPHGLAARPACHAAATGACVPCVALRTYVLF